LLMRDAAGTEAEIGSAPMPTDCSDPTRIELIQADYRVTLRVAGRDLIQTTPGQFAPDLPFLLNAFTTMEKLPKPRISLTAERQEAELSHISIWRDVYFTNRERGTGDNITIRNRPQPLPAGWGTPENFPRRIIHLGPDEYFTCGDNSLISGDGRYWNAPIDLPHENLRVEAGRVPGRFLLGKAFFVYWPAGFRPIPGQAVPAIVPNFGRMRFIH
ncbi:MAG: S26 family signal peptidase, partial [Phycisphaerae bacterium]|nr:S26 family signal peptidase [Phycisphaerae bacterium]